MSTNAADWILCAPVEPREPLTPGSGRSFPPVNWPSLVETESPRIEKLFRSTILAVDELSWHKCKRGDVLYGFSGPMKSNILIMRWNATNIVWLKGTVRC